MIETARGVTVPEPEVRAFIQARMSSARFPGKVLAPFRGRPLIASVIARVADVLGADAIVVATSTDASDDPLDAYVRQCGVSVFRGPLDDVLGRFQACLQAYPCRWLLRVSADSPLLDTAALRRLTAETGHELDLVTNVFPRTFPRGHSLELLRGTTFAALDRSTLDARACEHVTTVYYEHPERFRILNVTSPDPSRAALNLCVDTVDDLRRLEACEESPA